MRHTESRGIRVQRGEGKMNKPIGYDSRHYVDEKEIMHRYDEGMSVDALTNLVVQRNGVKKKEALNIVETTLLKHYKETAQAN